MAEQQAQQQEPMAEVKEGEVKQTNDTNSHPSEEIKENNVENGLPAVESLNITETTTTNENEKKEDTDNKENNDNESGEKFDPTKNLKESQLEALQKMREKTEKYFTTDEEREWANDMCLLRYLRARDYSVQKAKKLLKATVLWRRETRPQDIKIEDVEPLARLGVLYTNGFDKKGRPVLYGKPYKETAKGTPSKEINGEMRFKNLLYWLHKGYSNMDESKGVETFCLITDYKDYSRKHMDMKTNMNVMHVLLNHAPERMGITFFLDPPFLFWMGWKMISPFLNEVTMAKVRFVYSEKNKEGKRICPAILEHIDAEMLEEEYGGTSKRVYDYDSYVENGYKVV